VTCTPLFKRLILPHSFCSRLPSASVPYCDCQLLSLALNKIILYHKSIHTSTIAMAASRTSSLRALKQLTKSTSTITQQTRTLRITQHVEASPYLTTQKPSLTRVQAAIDEAASQKDSAAKASSVPNTRQFNTSRSLKSVGDSSTIDFAYLPDFDPDAGLPAPIVRVPLLPDSLYPQSTKTSYSKEEEAIVHSPFPL
jgi:hypothetical protein